MSAGLHLAPAFAGLLLAAAWWFRERRMAAQRRALAKLNALCEEILLAHSPQEIVKRLEAVLPQALRVTGLRVFLYDQDAETLAQITAGDLRPPVCVPINAVADTLALTPALCFRNRTRLAIPDTERSPFAGADGRGDTPRSLFLVPMSAQRELLGVLELQHAAKVRLYRPEEEAALQHLANQIAFAVKLLEQQSQSEQLFRSKQLAAAGQAVSGVADELKAPVEAILASANSLLAAAPEPAVETELRAIAAQADRAAGIISRLTALGSPGQSAPGRVCLNELLKAHIVRNAARWEQSGLKVRADLGGPAVWVSGVEEQLGKVVAELLLRAEQGVTNSQEKNLSVGVTALAGRALVEIGYSAPARCLADGGSQTAISASSLGLELCLGIVRAHGGELRQVSSDGSTSRYEIEFPVAEPRGAPAPASSGVPGRALRRLTTLLAEPDVNARRELLRLLGDRGHRVVPVLSGEEALDLIHRLPFDALFCSVHLAGLNWVKLHRRSRARVGSFVLLTEGYMADRAGGPGEEGALVLHKPVQEDALDQLLANIEALPAPR